MKFRNWFEVEMGQNPVQQMNSPLQEDGEMTRLFHQAQSYLTGGLKVDPTFSLSKLNNGPKGAANLLKTIFNRLNELGEPWKTQSQNTRDWLNNLSNGEINSTASATVGNLLAKLFGKKLYEKVMQQPAPIDSTSKPSTEFQSPNKQQQTLEKNPIEKPPSSFM